MYKLNTRRKPQRNFDVKIRGIVGKFGNYAGIVVEEMQRYFRKFAQIIN